MTTPDHTPPDKQTNASSDRMITASLVIIGVVTGVFALAATRPWQLAVGWVAALCLVAVGTHRAAKGAQK